MCDNSKTDCQHTQGELFYDPNTESLGYSGGWIARMGQKRQDDDPHGDQDADGERLAACWNACVGVSTEELRLRASSVEVPEKQDWADRLASLTWFIGKHVFRFLAGIGLSLHVYALWCICVGKTKMLPETVWGIMAGSLLVTIVLMMLESIRWIINRRDRT
jgi:hypothetical protein